MIDSSNPPTEKKTRYPTMLQQLTTRRVSGYKYPIEFDQWIDALVGEFAHKFKSYLGMPTQNKVSILLVCWERVEDGVKSHIFRDILIYTFITLHYPLGNTFLT